MAKRRSRQELKTAQRLADYEEKIKTWGDDAVHLTHERFRTQAVIGELYGMLQKDWHNRDSYIEDIRKAAIDADAAAINVLDCFRQIGDALHIIDQELMPGVLAIKAPIFHGQTFLNAFTQGVGAAQHLTMDFIDDFDPEAHEPKHPAIWLKRMRMPLTEHDVQRMVALSKNWDTLQKAVVWNQSLDKRVVDDLDMDGALRLIDLYQHVQD